VQAPAPLIVKFAATQTIRATELLMANRSRGLIRRIFGFIWDTINFFRRLVLNLLFLAIVAVIVAAWLAEERAQALPNTALVLDIRGPIVEQRTGTSSNLGVVQTLADQVRETQLRDLLAVLDAAAKDQNISRALLLLDDFRGAGLATLHEVAAAIERFRASGKQVIAWGSAYDQRRYYLAAHADQVLLHPFGGVLLQGFGGYRNYYRDALDAIGVTVNVFKAGEYKSLAEPFTQNEPSESARRDEAALLNDLWAQYVAGVETARKLPAGSITQMIEELPTRLAAVEGDAAKLALQEKLVDGLMTRDELRAMLTERGIADEKRKTFRQVSFMDYLSDLPERSGDAVGVVVASGEILEGEQPQGLVGGRSTAELIRRAREDSSIKAVLLRVDSPGGSVFASELIRHEMELTQKAGKPALVSFGDVAASGGYWISMAADEVIADPAAITGSIGVIALIPSADKAWDKLSLHTHGTTTTWLAGALDPRRPLDPRARELLQTGVTRTYKEFISRAAAARNITPEKMDQLAQGRAWTGRQAFEGKLVDRLGSYHESLQAAARRGGLGDDFRVDYIEREPSRIDRLLGAILGQDALTLVLPPVLSSTIAEALPDSLRSIRVDLLWLRDAVRKPLTLQSHCLCSADSPLGAD
jgi:protease-4